MQGKDPQSCIIMIGCYVPSSPGPQSTIHITCDQWQATAPHVGGQLCSMLVTRAERWSHLSTETWFSLHLSVLIDFLPPACPIGWPVVSGKHHLRLQNKQGTHQAVLNKQKIRSRRPVDGPLVLTLRANALADSSEMLQLKSWPCSHVEGWAALNTEPLARNSAPQRNLCVHRLKENLPSA